jgi:hypothetical protein
MRYVLTHGLRFLIIFFVIMLYSYLTIYLRRHFGRVETMSNASSTFSGSRKKSFAKWRFRQKSFGEGTKFEDGDEHHEAQLKATDLDSSMLQMKQCQGQQDCSRITPSPGCIIMADDMSRHSSTIDPTATGYSQRGNDPMQNLKGAPTHPGKVGVAIGGSHQQHQFPAAPPTVSSQEYVSPSVPCQDPVQKIQKILLMRVYPTLYIIFWIPGIANRLVEASGGTSQVLQLCQASTQFIGLANAIFYGWNENTPKLIKRYWKEKRSRKEDVGGV